VIALDPAEVALAHEALSRTWMAMPAGQALPAKRLLDRLGREAIRLGPLVFQLEFLLFSDAMSRARPVKQARAELREKLGVKKLPAGVGPKLVVVPYAPTMNEYNGLLPGEKVALRSGIDGAIVAAKAAWPAWSCGATERAVVRPRAAKKNASAQAGKKSAQLPYRILREGGRRRAVIVTRESNRRPDDISADVIGGKIPLDRLVHALVLRDDDDEWLVRMPRWKMAPRDAGKVRIEVYELVGTQGTLTLA
jgi:hypothetical protein